MKQAVREGRLTLAEVRAWTRDPKNRPAPPKAEAPAPGPVEKKPEWSRDREFAELEAEMPTATAERKWEIVQRQKALLDGAGPLPDGFETITAKRARLERELAAATDNDEKFRVALELGSL